MLESLRKQGASVAIYLIFGLLIVIFVINFAPNAGQGTGGCMGQSTTAIKVDGHKANQTSYKIAYSGNQYNGRQKVYVALEMLIRRELLAQEGEKRGLRVTGDMLDEEIKKGFFFLGGNRNKLDFWIDDVAGEKFFNFGKLKGWVSQLNVSMNSYKDEQARGLQAALMAEMLADTVRVSREEALADYLFENNTVTYDLVEFSPTPYKTAMRLTDADVSRFLAGHEAEVKKKFADDERTYKATKPAIELRSIFIQKLVEAPKPADAPNDGPKPADGAGSGSAGSAAPPADKTAEKPADKKPDEKKTETAEAKKPAVKPVGMPVDAAKSALEAARTAITGGKQKFADAAKTLSTDDAAKAAGGYVGWKPVDNAQLGDKAVNDAVKALKPGEMTPVIATDNGVYLVMAEAKREGDLTYDQVKNEIAMELAKDVWSKEAAKRAALEALASARAGTGKPLDQLYSADPAEVNRKMQEDIQRQIQQMQLQQKSGFYTPPSTEKDVLASWQAQAGGPSGSAAPAAGSGSAAGSAGSAAGSASGSAAGSAATPAPTPTPAPATTTIEASKDVLPSFGEVKTPFLETIGPVPHANELPGVGENKAAIASMFDELTPGMLAKQVFESDGTYVVLQLKDKQQPKMDEFDKTADQKVETLRAIRGAMLLENWLKTQCEAFEKDGKIEPLAELIRETDDKGNPLPQSYRPCMSFR